MGSEGLPLLSEKGPEAPPTPGGQSPGAGKHLSPVPKQLKWQNQILPAEVTPVTQLTTRPHLLLPSVTHTRVPLQLQRKPKSKSCG